MNHPAHPRHLEGSKWTAAKPADRELHWTVTGFARQTGEVTLAAVLTGRRCSVPWRALRSRDDWLPGWVVAPDEPDEPTEADSPPSA